MRLTEALRGLKKPFFTLDEAAEAAALSVPSARVLCSRKARSGELIRAKRGVYLIAETFAQWTEKDLFLLSNILQTPSYISLTTALSYYGLTTQILPSLIEAVNPVRSREYEVQGIIFRYSFEKAVTYFGYERQEGFFIAEPEKALLDCLTLLSLGRYALDRSALDPKRLRGLRWNQIERWLTRYPRKVRQHVLQWRRDYENAAAA